MGILATGSGIESGRFLRRCLTAVSVVERQWLWGLLILSSGFGSEIRAQNVEPRQGRELVDAATAEVETSFLPMDLLPPGTVMQGVRLPRYRGEVFLGEVIAQSLLIVNPELVRGDQVVLRMIGKEGGSMLRAELGEAEYDLKDGIMHARGGVRLSEARFNLLGSELDIDLGSRQGWLTGVVRGWFLYEERGREQEKNAGIEIMDMRTLNCSLLAAGCIGSSMAAPPDELTAADWERVATDGVIVEPEIALSSQRQLGTHEKLAAIATRPTEAAAEATKQLNSSNAENKSINREMNTFLGRMGREPVTMAVATEGPQKAVGRADPINRVQAAGEIEPLGLPEEVEPQENDNRIRLNCEGGMYFDLAQGLLIYNDQVKVRHNQLSLDCSQQLKVFLKEKKAKGEVTAKAVEGQRGEPNVPEFGAIERLVAIGDVVMVTTDAKGEKVTATAQQASYHLETGVILLSGGNQTLRNSQGFMRVTGPDSYIKVSETEGVVVKGKTEQDLKIPNKR